MGSCAVLCNSSGFLCLVDQVQTSVMSLDIHGFYLNNNIMSM